MSFLAVLLALLVEQFKPLPRDNKVHDGLVTWVAWTGRNFDAGKPQHAWVVWGVSVLGPALLAGVVYVVIARWSVLLALVFNVVMLYLTLGFRQFSHYFTDIRDAMERGNETEARRLLGEWRHLDASELPRTEVLRHVIEHALLAAHRHVFGVFFCFVVLAAVGLGPAGAVLYRMAEFSSRYWGYRLRNLDLPANDGLRELSRQLFGWIDHVPARMTAFGFALVGNFEEAIAGWRRDAVLWLNPNEGVILASAAGAVGVQLGGSAPPGVTPDRSKTFSVGGESGSADAQGYTAGLPPVGGHLQTVVGLVWRSVLLWMVPLALLTVARAVA
jgi:adenosylcobinamide-phosphate synthase